MRLHYFGDEQYPAPVMMALKYGKLTAALWGLKTMLKKRAAANLHPGDCSKFISCIPKLTKNIDYA